MINEKRLKYLKLLNDRYSRNQITKREYEKEIRWIRKNIKKF